MSRPSPSPRDPEMRKQRRIANAHLTSEQRAAVEARRLKRHSPRYQAELASDIEVYRREYPPVRDTELFEAIAALRRERKQQGLSLTDMAERTGIDRATISKLETGKLTNPTIGTIGTYAQGARVQIVVDSRSGRPQPLTGKQLFRPPSHRRDGRNRP